MPFVLELRGDADLDRMLRRARALLDALPAINTALPPNDECVGVMFPPGVVVEDVSASPEPKQRPDEPGHAPEGEQVQQRTGNGEPPDRVGDLYPADQAGLRCPTRRFRQAPEEGSQGRGHDVGVVKIRQVDTQRGREHQGRHGHHRLIPLQLLKFLKHRVDVLRIVSRAKVLGVVL